MSLKQFLTPIERVNNSSKEIVLETNFGGKVYKASSTTILEATSELFRQVEKDYPGIDLNQRFYLKEITTN
jgi:molybdenum-dependent DNA-binding transcriptional regulator ModE